MQSLAWLALAFALVGDSAVDHLHSSSHERGAGFVTQHAEMDREGQTTHGESAASSATLLGASPPSDLLPDVGHEDHSSQATLERAPCGVCRSIESPWMLRGAAIPNANDRVLASRSGESTATRQSVMSTRRHPPRAPPTDPLA